MRMGRVEEQCVGVMCRVEGLVLCAVQGCDLYG